MHMTINGEGPVDNNGVDNHPAGVYIEGIHYEH